MKHLERIFLQIRYTAIFNANFTFCLFYFMKHIGSIFKKKVTLSSCPHCEAYTKDFFKVWFVMKNYAPQPPPPVSFVNISKILIQFQRGFKHISFNVKDFDPNFRHFNQNLTL